MMSGFEYAGRALAAVHGTSNRRKQEAYWLGFLRGVLASEKVEEIEIPSLRAEAERFLRLLGDEDAGEILRDLDTQFDDYHSEVYAALDCIVEHRSRHFVPDSPKDLANGFFGFCAGIACDDRIVEKEVEKLLEEINRTPELEADSRISALRRTAARAISDGHVSPEESADIAGWICRLVGDSCADTGLATFGNVPVLDDSLRDHTQVIFPENIFVVTGIFSIAPRKVIKSVIVDLGGETSESVTRKTNYLVIGGEASRDWKHSHEGTKLIRARELRQDGAKPHLVDEGVIRKALGNAI